MARQARKLSKSGIYHLMIRGINKQNLFEEDEDRQRLVDTLGNYKMIGKYKIYGYCLMSNHIHMLIREADESISTTVKRISSSYVYWYNQKYSRVGHLFQERFRSEAVETDEYFLMVLRYIHQNPVRSGMVTDVGKYQWSSYQEYVGNTWITDVEFALDILSEDRMEAIRSFISYTNEQSTEKCLDWNERTNLPDKAVMELLHKLQIKNISELQRLEKVRRDAILRKMKELRGATIRQIARLTGISKSVIDRA